MPADLAPCLLIASPTLGCPFFNHSVVLLVDHNPEGSVGFVVNRASGMDLGEVLDHVGMRSEDSAGAKEPVLLGGPVAPQTGWVVLDVPEGMPAAEGSVRVFGNIVVSASMDVLGKIARGVAPERHFMLLGYAGWGPGQLDQEIREGSWIAVDVDANLMFETPLEDRWRAALTQAGIDPARVVASRVADA